MDAAGIISNCNARRMSCFISGLIFLASSSAGKLIGWSLMPPLIGRLSACVINRIREAAMCGAALRTSFEPLVALHFRADAAVETADCGHRATNIN